MPQFNARVSQPVLDHINALAARYGVTQAEVLEVFFGELPEITGSQESALTEFGAKRFASSPSAKKVIKALDGLSEEQIGAILAARKTGQPHEHDATL